MSARVAFALALLCAGCASPESPSPARDAATDAPAATDAAAVRDATMTDVPEVIAPGRAEAHTWAGRPVRVWVPRGYRAEAPAPLVLMLHGCGQDPDDFARGTGMDDVADAAGALVLYPAQTASANALRCWNWAEASHQSRDAGEPAALAAAVAEAGRAYAVDPRRVYVAGFSAGAAMAVILGATHPDVFAAVGVHSGLEFAAASNAFAGLAAMRTGGPDPQAQGDAAFAAMGPRARVVPVMVFHGDADGTVAAVNGDQVVAQWARTNDRADGDADGSLSPTPSASEAGEAGGRRFVRESFRDARRGAEVIARYRLLGAGHAWSGGRAGGSYVTEGPDASALLWAFFAQHPR